MPSTSSPAVQRRYQNRPDDSVPTNFSLSREAAALLSKYSESGLRSRGQFLSRLIVEHDRRVTFREFVEVECLRELRKIARAVRREVRRQNDV
jgi:hypothetical protein